MKSPKTGVKGQGKRAGWYPHRYGVEDRQSYWDGLQWTGQSRHEPAVVSPKPVLGWISVGFVVGAVFIGLTALFGDEFLGFFYFASSLAFFIWIFVPTWKSSRRLGLRGVVAVVVIGLSTAATVHIGFEYLIDL